MLFARKLLDNFIDNIPEAEKLELYQLSETQFNDAMARFALLYEEMFKDYPSGLLIDMMEQHLQDKLFQKQKKLAIG